MYIANSGSRTKSFETTTLEYEDNLSASVQNNTACFSSKYLYHVQIYNYLPDVFVKQNRPEWVAIKKQTSLFIARCDKMSKWVKVEFIATHDTIYSSFKIVHRTNVIGDFLHKTCTLWQKLDRQRQFIIINNSSYYDSSYYILGGRLYVALVFTVGIDIMIYVGKLWVLDTQYCFDKVCIILPKTLIAFITY